MAPACTSVGTGIAGALAGAAREKNAALKFFVTMIVDETGRTCTTNIGAIGATGVTIIGGSDAEVAVTQ